ncbi:hypothetical protein [Burkholderia ubonensis]|uniref:Terminase small subunit n=1 Tax=Burkholderia ubonensis TaxID=101571 RepID=A0ABD4E1F3_9BURK|nr:hypothetical protein [Burkholderia ubonensis]KVN83461.1 hypothetical protein WJ68_16245 [Burkholderia ubonensis]
MATKTITTGGRRAGKTTAMNDQVAQANAKGAAAAVVGREGVTVHEPGKKPRKVPRTQVTDAPKDGKEKRTAARKTAAKSPAKGKAAPKAVKPPVEPASTPAPAAKRPVGRPTVYRDEFCNMLLSFFRIDVEREVEVTKQDKDGKPVTVTETVVNRFPTLERFADSINVTRQTLHDWATAVESDGTTLKHPEFSYTYARARDLQAALIQEGGMGGLYESRFATLAAKNLAGWRDQVEQTVTATVTQATVDELDALYADGMAQAEAGRNAVAARRQAREEAQLAGQGK